MDKIGFRLRMSASLSSNRAAFPGNGRRQLTFSLQNSSLQSPNLLSYLFRSDFLVLSLPAKPGRLPDPIMPPTRSKRVESAHNAGRRGVFGGVTRWVPGYIGAPAPPRFPSRLDHPVPARFRVCFFECLNTFQPYVPH